MKGSVRGGFVTAAVPKLVGESVMRWKVVTWLNGPHPGFTEATYEGGGRWCGPRCVFIAEVLETR